MNEEHKERPGLNLDVSQITDAGYRDFIDSLSKLEIRCVEKQGKCVHNVGDSFVYKIPYQKPEKVCYALQHVLELYNWRVALGVPSWNNDERDVYKFRCPSQAGTVWEMKRVD